MVRIGGSLLCWLRQLSEALRLNSLTRPDTSLSRNMWIYLTRGVSCSARLLLETHTTAAMAGALLTMPVFQRS